MVSPTEVTLRVVASRAVRMDAFESLLALAGLDDFSELPSNGAPLASRDAVRILAVLLRKPVTLGSFPPRTAVGYLLREVLEGGDGSRQQLALRAECFRNVVVLRPDGYLAWAFDGRTQQKAGPVEWRSEVFRAGPFELGRFYVNDGGIFRRADAQLRPMEDEPPLAEVYDDNDVIGRTLDGAQDAFVELYQAIGKLCSYPLDSLAAFERLPAAVSALIASSPAYLEHLRYMTRGERVKALSKLTTQLLVTFGTAGGTTSTLTRAFAGAEATLPVLSLSSERLLVIERATVPVGRVATVLSGGPGAAIVLQRVNAAGQNSSPPIGPGQWGPAEESMSARARAYQEWISGHSADDAYWVGGVGRKSGGVKFDGFKDGLLLEAKGPGYANKFLDNLDPKRWFKNSGAQALVDQAKRQVAAAKGIPIRWHIAEQSTANGIRKLFQDNGIFAIDIVHVPPL